MLISKIWNNIQKSIEKKILLLLLGAAVIPVLFFIFHFYQRSVEETQDNYIRYNTSLLSQSGSRIADYFSQLNSISLSIYSDIFYSSTYHTSDRELYAYNEKVRKMMEIYMQRKETATAAYYDCSGKELYLVNRIFNKAFPDMEKIEQTEWYQTAVSAKGTLVIKGNQKLPELIPGEEMEMESTVFTVSRAIFKLNRLEGVLLISYGYNALDEIAKQVVLEPEETVLLVEDDAECIYSFPEEDHGAVRNITMDILKEAASEETSFSYQEDSGERFETLCQELPEFGLYWIKLIPKDQLYRQSNAALRMILTVCAVILITMALIIACIFKWFTHPLRRLKQGMERAGEGDLSGFISNTRKDEIGVITDSYNMMIRKLNDLISQQHEMDIRYKDAQMLALQSQLNPHFLYNTLQGIASVACDENVPEVEQMLIALSRMLRYSVKGSDNTATLREEVENVRNYLMLQKFRYEDRLNYEMNIDEEILTAAVPRLILQPLAENAILHGLEPSKDKCTISFGCHVQEDALHVWINDDGVGIAQEKLEMIRKDLQQGADSLQRGTSCIGLANVYQRLYLMYGSDFHFTIDSTEGKGTDVRIVIPLSKGPERGAGDVSSRYSG